MDSQNNQLNWHDMKILLSVYRLNSASLAAKELNVSHQTISRRISALEKSLGVRLVDRNSTSWKLTAHATAIAKQAESMEAAVLVAEQNARSQANEMTGRVKLTTGHVAFQWLLIPVIRKVKKQFPFIQFDFIADNSMLDLSIGEADIALRFTLEPNKQLIGRHVSKIPFCLYGLKKFISEFDTASQNNESIDIPVINLSLPKMSASKWPENIISSDSLVHSTNDLSVVISAVSNGLGIGFLPQFIGAQLPKIHKSNCAPVYYPFDLWLLTNEDTRHSTKIKTVYHSLYRALNEQLCHGS